MSPGGCWRRLLLLQPGGGRSGGRERRRPAGGSGCSRRAGPGGGGCGERPGPCPAGPARRAPALPARSLPLPGPRRGAASPQAGTAQPQLGVDWDGFPCKQLNKARKVTKPHSERCRCRSWSSLGQLQKGLPQSPDVAGTQQSSARLLFKCRGRYRENPVPCPRDLGGSEAAACVWEQEPCVGGGGGGGTAGAARHARGGRRRLQVGG